MIARMLASIFLLFAVSPPAATVASYSWYVTIAIPNPQILSNHIRENMRNRPTLNFQGSVANFGTRFEFNQELEVDLFLPPGSKYLCGDGPSRNLRGTSDEDDPPTGAEEGEKPPHVEDWPARIPTLPTTSDRRDEEGPSRRLALASSTRPIALLVSSGVCSYETKARLAIAYNKMLGPSSSDGKQTARHPDRRIKYVIVYNDDPSMGESLVTMEGSPSSSARGLEVGMIFVSKNSGSSIESLIRNFENVRGDGAGPTLSGADYRIPSRADRTIGEGLWTFPAVLVTPEEPTSKNVVGTNDVGSTGSESDSFRWIRSFFFVLLSLLVVAPCAGATFLWHKAGGRVRFRRDEETGRIRGMEVIRPPPGWIRGRRRRRMVNTTTGGWRGDDGDDRRAMGGSATTKGKGKLLLSRDQVTDLPEIEYRATHPDEGGKTGGGTDGIATEAAAAAAANSFGGCRRTLSVGNLPHLLAEAALRPSLSVGNLQLLGMPRRKSLSVVRQPEASALLELAPLSAPPTRGDDADEKGVATTTMCTSCSICIEDFKEGEKLRLLPRCNHAFHTDCILPWLTERQGCCPLCKTGVLGDDDDKTDNGGGGDSEGGDGGDDLGTPTDIEMGTVATVTGTVQGGRDDGARDNDPSEGEGGQ